MKVKNLIEKLQKIDPELEVFRYGGEGLIKTSLPTIIKICEWNYYYDRWTLDIYQGCLKNEDKDKIKNIRKVVIL